MRKNILISIILLLIGEHGMAAGTGRGWAGGRAERKRLPLDGVPNVVMKKRETSHYFHDRVILKVTPLVGRSLSKSAFAHSSLARVLSRVAVSSTEPMFPTSPAARAESEVDLSLFYVVQYASPHDPFALSEELSNLPEVEYAEPWFIYPLSGPTFTPNDSLFAQQWGLEKIRARDAWDVTQGDSTIVIAIIDSGVELAHPDLRANLWRNPGEIPGNGIDDDGNGYIDDEYGWDFIGSDYRDPRGDRDPSPKGANNDHGTHVAGIAAAVTNNGIGVASIGFRSRIMAVKCTADNDTRGPGQSAYVLAGYQGIVYAADNGAHVVNCSWGGSGGSQFEQEVVNYATQKGSLVVGAAGNAGSDIFFSPAGYNGVLAVAATDQVDRKAVFSNYGDYVDVSAPGVNVISTMYPSTYNSERGWDGTSMSSPLVAGLAALVKSKFPHFTPLQVGEQVRVSSDDIDNLNPSYSGKLGRGRINAYAAVTITDRPSVRLQWFSISDSPGGNGNKIAQPGETIAIVTSFKNFLAPASPGAAVRLTSTTPHVTVLSGEFLMPSLGTLDSISNAADPFRVFIEPSVPQSFTATLHLTFTDGAFTDRQSISFLVNPTFQTHDINDIELTLTNNGRIGFFDFPVNNYGVGFVFNGTNHLFEGGLILGTSPAKVVDVVRNETMQNAQNDDFSSTSFYNLVTPGILSQQDGSTTFTDDGADATNRLGVRVRMYSYAYSGMPDPRDGRYILLRYDIKNTGAAGLTDLYAGIFLDWDVGNFGANISHYDGSRSLGYTYDNSATRREYVGIRALDGAASYRSLINDIGLDLSRAAKWSWISGGFGQVAAGPADVHHVISSGPFTVAPGDSVIVGFALVAAESSLAELQLNADAAMVRWGFLRGTNFMPVSAADDGKAKPEKFRVSQNYPNPFNPATRIKFEVPKSGPVSIAVFDLLGRQVAILVDGVFSPGTYTASWDASGFPSGVYLYRMRAGDFIETKKMTLVR